MALEALDPDARDIAEVVSPTLRPCPFCGGRPISHQSVNRTPTFAKAPVYRSVVCCIADGCGASVGGNALDPEEARAMARKAWQRRQPS